MKRVRKICLALLLLVSMIVPIIPLELYQAAGIYENAKEFYDYTDSQRHHTMVEGGNFYIGTSAKLASSSTNLKYYTLGWDMELVGNGCSITFSVVRGETMKSIQEAYREVGGAAYNIFCVETADLYRLAKVAGIKQGKSADVEKILDASVIKVYANAVMTTKRGNALHGSITEDGNGGLIPQGDVYHLKDADDLKEMKGIFKGHDFASYIEVEEKLTNYTLTILYKVGSNVTVSNGYTVSGGYIRRDGETYKEQYKIMQTFKLLNTNILQPKRTGYKLVPGAEWMLPNGYTFNITEDYMPKQIEPGVGFANKTVTLEANWQEIEYDIIYNANGGSGTVPTTHMKYNKPGFLSDCSFTRSGYILPKGKEWITADGKTYAQRDEVYNLTTKDGDKIVLYANWVPSVVTITTDKRGGTGGTDYFYEKYGVSFSLDKAFTSLTDRINIPDMPGYTFKGYYMNIFGTGDAIVDADGNIAVAPDYFTKDTTIHAGYEAKPFKITFDKQGGYGGTSEATAIYGEPLPVADGPVRTGYTFRGYYTERNGAGEMYYNEFMATDRKYTKLEDMTLYAYWEDNTAPEASLIASIDGWTNRQIKLTAAAWDYGSGLSNVKIYRGDELILDKNLDNPQYWTEVFYNEPEGVINYKLIATDAAGNQATAYKTVYYDITAPTGEIIDISVDGNIFEIIVDVTDVNPGR